MRYAGNHSPCPRDTRPRYRRSRAALRRRPRERTLHVGGWSTAAWFHRDSVRRHNLPYQDELCNFHAVAAIARILLGESLILSFLMSPWQMVRSERRA